MNQFFDKYSKIPISLRWLIIIAIPIVIFVILYFVVFDPKVKKLETKKQESKTLEVKYVENAAIRDNLPKFQEEVNILNQQLERAVTLLPNEANVHNLYKQLFVEAEKANIELLSFRPGNLARQDFYSELKLDVQLRGTYHRIAEFIDRIGKLDRIVNVNNISFSGVTNTNNATILELTTTITTYTFSSGASSVGATTDDESDDRRRRRRRRR